jgi:hypothetical protein
MTKYLLLLTYKAAVWVQSATAGGITDHVSDRAAQRFETAGGSLDSFNYALDDSGWHGVLIGSLPDDDAAASISLAQYSTGAVDKVHVLRLLEPEDVKGLLAKVAVQRGLWQLPQPATS